MVKLSQNSDEPKNTDSINLQNGSCSKISETLLKKNENSSFALKVTASNGTSASKVPVQEVIEKNNCEMCNDKFKGNSFGCSKKFSIVNGNSGKKLAVNDGQFVNCNSAKMLAINNTPTVNGDSGKKMPMSYADTVNGNTVREISVNNTSTNGNSDKEKSVQNDALTVNGNSNTEVSVNDTKLINGNSALKLPVRDVPTRNEDRDFSINSTQLNNNNKDCGNSTNDSNTLPQNGSSDIPESESCGEDLVGFTTVVNKKKQKSKQKYHRKKPISNLPPGPSIEKIKRDSGDKKLSEKTSPTHSSKPPSRNFAANRSSEKSYSSALLSGQTVNSHFIKSVGNVSSNTQIITKCAELNTSSNTSKSSETSPAASLSSPKSDEVAVTNEKLASECKQSNTSTKVEMTRVSTQTDDCVINDLPQSQNECLLASEEVLQESEKINSPIDFVDVADCVETIDESSNAAYCDSVVSNDSGRGDSEVAYDADNPYCCEFPKDKVRNLIGKYGSYKQEIEKLSGATFWVSKTISINENTTLVKFYGTGAQIEKAKEIIKKRFRHASLKQWIHIPTDQLFNSTPVLSENYNLFLPIKYPFQGVVSCIFTPQYFWLQPFGHPCYHPLEDLEKRMSEHFNSNLDAPGVVNPNIGFVVAAPVFVDERTTRWVRGEIVNLVAETETVIVRYLDHGGEAEIPASEIRPMRHDFLNVPFFAAKCCLSKVLPPGETWPEESCAEFKRLCSNIYNPPTIIVDMKVAEGYFVTITVFDDESKEHVDVASTLINKGLAAPFDFRVYPDVEPSTELVQ